MRYIAAAAVACFLAAAAALACYAAAIIDAAVSLLELTTRSL